MENRNSYTIVGIFFMLCMLFLGIFFWWMATKTEIGEAYRSYYIHTKELPNGLKEDAQVKFIGVPAGIVKKIGFYDIENAVIEIELNIKEKFPISKDSLAKVEVQGITGIAYVNISKGSGKIFEKDDDKPIISLDETLLNKIGSRAMSISDRLDYTLQRVNIFLSDDNMEKFNQTISSLESFTKIISDAQRFEKLDSIIFSVDNLMKSLDNNKSGIDAIAKNANNLILNADKFITAATSAASALNLSQTLVTDRIKRGDYNIREILQPTLIETKKMLIEFNKSLKEFRDALFRLEDDPYNFFFKNTKNQKDNQ